MYRLKKRKSKQVRKVLATPFQPNNILTIFDPIRRDGERYKIKNSKLFYNENHIL